MLVDYKLTIKEKNEALIDELRGANKLVCQSKFDMKLVNVARKWLKEGSKIMAIRLLRSWFNTELRQTYDAVNKYLL